MSLVRVVDPTDLIDPVLVIALDGWIDAGEAAAEARAEIVDRSSRLVADFDTDQLFDHRARRPNLRIEDGLVADLQWPELRLDQVADDRGRDVLVLHGAEPDHTWRRLLDEIVVLVEDLEVSMVCGLGAYPAAAPHTRTSRLSCTASTPELRERHPFTVASVDVPAGLQSAVEWAVHRRGIPAIGLWAQVPHYLSGMAYPEASAALLDGLDAVAGRRFDATDLRQRAIAVRSHVDSLIEDNPAHVEMVRELEAAHDTEIATTGTGLPSGDDLAAQLEQFLRDRDDP